MSSFGENREKYKSSFAIGGSPLLWLALFLLLILFLSFGLLVSTVVQCVSDPNPNIISLNMDPSELEDNLWYSIIYRKAEANPDAVTYSTAGQWEVNTQVDIFRDSYISESGSAIARSEDGSSIVAPGTSGSYDFTLKNVGNIVLNYTLSLSGQFEVSGKTVPLYLRLLKNGEPAESAYGSWTYGIDIENMQETGTLAVGQSADYTLEWLWPFEDSEEFPTPGDEYDTWLGDNPAFGDEQVLITLLTLSEEVPGAVAVDENGVPIYEEVFDPAQRALLIGLAAVSLGALGGIIFLLARRRIFVTGYVKTAAPTLSWSRQDSVIYETGRFCFKAVPAGKHTFALKDAEGSTLATWEWKLVRRYDRDPLLSLEEKDGRTVLTLDRSVRAIELNFTVAGEKLLVSAAGWNLIDKDNAVITAEGKRIERDDNDENRTPLGLEVDKKHRFTVPEEQSHEA